MTYREWIKLYVERNGGRVHARCREATEEMAKAFPELKRAAGWAHLAGGGALEHWWLVAENGAVIDPTVAQFPMGVISYEPWEPSKEVRVGKCMNCGSDIFRTVQKLGGGERVSICSPECEVEFVCVMDGEEAARDHANRLGLKEVAKILVATL